MTPFERLHPAVQYHIVNSLGWPALRELQERAVEPVLEGAHCLMIAPTAGGKTEAAVLPVLSRMLQEDWHGISVLYICPIKALLNNLEPRLTMLAELLGRKVSVWHGDVTQSTRNRVERELPDVLLTTPESIEGMFVGSRRSHDRLLGNVRCVVVDELHAFAGDDRGWHLMALLERIRALSQTEPQRIGLSATVGNPETLLHWFAGHCEGVTDLIQVSGTPQPSKLTVDYVGTLENAATVISQLHRGEKRLVFADSRNQVETLAVALRSRGVDVFVSHAALSRDARAQAEAAFAERKNCVIVATSTLELGIDVGDLDRVIQIDAPGSVASFLQRIGRTGRREGATRNTLFLCISELGLLKACAITVLTRTGHVEPVIAPPRPYAILVQQLLASMFASGMQFEPSDLVDALQRVPEFGECFAEEWEKVIAHLLDTDILSVADRHTILGPKGDRQFSGKGLAELCVSFQTPRSLPVFHGSQHLGEVDPLGLPRHEDRAPVIALGGRTWEVRSVNLIKGVIHVAPTDRGGRSRWIGSVPSIPPALAMGLRGVLENPGADIGARLTSRASQKLGEIREDRDYTLDEAAIYNTDGHIEVWTYAGSAYNEWLAGAYRAAGWKVILEDAFCVEVKSCESEAEPTPGRGFPNAPVELRPKEPFAHASMLPEQVNEMVRLRRIIAEAGEAETKE